MSAFISLPSIIKATVRPALYPRRFHAYCVGAMKSGTHSLSGLLEGNYRARHEPDKTALIHHTVGYLSKQVSAEQYRRFLAYRDKRLWLEMDSSNFNIVPIELMVALFPQAKFILTMRECIGWLNSCYDHLLTRHMIGEIKVYLEELIHPERYPHSAHEEVLLRHGLPSIDAMLHYWCWHNSRVIATVPAERLLIVSTNAIQTSIPQVAAFLGIEQSRFDVVQAHLYVARKKNNLLSQISPHYIAERASAVCGELMQKYFPHVPLAADVIAEKLAHNAPSVQPASSPPSRRECIAYVMSRFPKPTETFIFNEIIALQQKGWRIAIFPLVLEKGAHVHPETHQLMEHVHFEPLLSRQIIAAQLFWLRRSWKTYLAIWFKAIVFNLGSPKFLSRVFVTLPRAAFFARRMLTLQCVHLHAHYATHPTLAAWCVHRLLGVKYTFTAHAHDIYVERPMLRQKIAAAQRVITISEFNKQLLGRLFGEQATKKIEVIRCGVDSDFFAPSKTKTRNATPMIVCNASFHPYKGHRYLIEACRILRSEQIAFHCVLIGGGGLERSIRKAIDDYGLSDAFTLAGALPRTAIREYLEIADMFVLPSIVTKQGKMEGIPVALMEALAMKVPVITTNISGIPELVEHQICGLLVQQQSPQELAAAIKQVIDNPAQAQARAERGFERVQTLHSHKNNCAQLCRLIEGMVAAC